MINIKKIIATGLIANMCVVPCNAASIDTRQQMDEKQKSIEIHQIIKRGSHEIAEKARARGDIEDSYTIILAKTYWESSHRKYLELKDEYDKLLKQYEQELAKEEAIRKQEEEKRKREEEARRRQLEKGTLLGSFRISAYTPSPSENGGYAVTATGAPLSGNEWAICAVDTNVIPLGSTIYIEGVGNVRACDTGGAIKGNRIDLLVGYGQANSWGVQYRNVYIK